MQILWLWLVAVTGEIATALYLAQSNPAVQRVATWVMGRAETILQRCQELYRVIQSGAGGSIITNTRPIVDTIMDSEWPVIEAELVRIGMDSTVIQELRAGLANIAWEKWIRTFTSFAEQAQRNNPGINPFDFWRILPKSRASGYIQPGMIVTFLKSSGKVVFAKRGSDPASIGLPFSIKTTFGDQVRQAMNPWPMYGKIVSVGNVSDEMLRAIDIEPGKDDVVVPPFSPVSAVNKPVGTGRSSVAGPLIAFGGVLLSAIGLSMAGGRR